VPTPEALCVLGEARHPWPAADCLPGVVAEADNKEGEHDSRSSTSIARPNTIGVPHLRVRARRGRYERLTISSSKSVWLDLDNLKNRTECVNLEVGEMA
jgi:hypothetical protein